MQAIAGSIVVLAGAMLICASLITQAWLEMNNRPVGAGSQVAGFGGGFLILAGLVVLFTGMAADNRRNRPTPV
jgi:hypothetical protein